MIDSQLVTTIVINLKRSPERRVFMEQQLYNLKINFTTLEATDGKALSSQAIDSIYDRGHSKKLLGKELQSGEIACAASHLRALELFLNSDARFGLIMEDDITLDRRLPLAVFTVTAKADTDEKIYVQFDHAPVGWKGLMLWWFLFGNLVRSKHSSPLFWLQFPFYILKGITANFLTLYEGGRDLYFTLKKSGAILPSCRDRYLAGCYLVSRSAAAELIALNTPILYAADAVHNIARRRKLIQHYLYTPRLVRQKREEFNSDLNDDHFGKKVIAY